MPEAPQQQLTPPDMQGAGMPQPQAQGGILDALRSLGGSPPQAMGQANPGTAFGSGVLSAIGGQPGANPYLQGVQSQANSGFYQQLNLMQEQRRQQEAQDRRADAKIRAQQANIKLTGDLLDRTPEGSPLRPVLARQLAGTYAQAIPGVPVGPLAVDLAQGPLSKEKTAMALDMIDAGVTPDMIGEATGLNPQQVQKISGIANSESARKALGFSTRAENKAKQADEQKKSLVAAREKWGLMPKDPRTPFAMKYAMETYGKSFEQLSDSEQKETVEASQVLAVKNPAPTTAQRDAIAEFGGDINNPRDVQQALNRKRAVAFQNNLQLAGQKGQLTAAGHQYTKVLEQNQKDFASLQKLDELIDDMDRLVAEGKSLHLTDDPKAINAAQQFLTHWTGGPKSKGAQWIEAFGTLDARFTAVAKTVEQISSARLAVQNVQRALHYHPKISDPYTVQQRVIQELKHARDQARGDVNAALAKGMRDMSEAAGRAGVPFVLGEESHEAESAEEEP